ncbi:hypothetical protein JDM601_2066 [Mycolicibacter sinensis]|uniref:Uncharacterized protein n=1 Tax=Mycolicibacter sinensis (strain JDM601) TaxID=875328 RepID=F5YSR5_MYCSD|nr:hypothetical protein JDM601_2066 [Mycolicibacter sinensis]
MPHREPSQRRQPRAVLAGIGRRGRTTIALQQCRRGTREVPIAVGHHTSIKRNYRYRYATRSTTSSIHALFSGARATQRGIDH